MSVPTININMDKKCAQCGKKGATQSGLCLDCAADKIIGKDKTKHRLYELAMEVIELKEERRGINEVITAKKDEVERLGLSKLAFDRALEYYEKLKDGKITNFDRDYCKMREALNLPIQYELSFTKESN